MIRPTRSLLSVLNNNTTRYLDHLMQRLSDALPPPRERRDEEARRNLGVQAMMMLKQNDGNLKKTAEQMNLKRNTVRKLPGVEALLTLFRQEKEREKARRRGHKFGNDYCRD